MPNAHKVKRNLKSLENQLVDSFFVFSPLNLTFSDYFKTMGGKDMNRPNSDYTAIQTEEGFHIVFHDSMKAPLKVTFSDLQAFIQKINQNIMAGKRPSLTDEEEVLLTLWQMLLIPENIVH
jgi:hypothetical protein